MARPRLLDLFCGAGGAGMGYYRAGFEVVGIDINPQKHYPFEFHQADAMTYPLDGFDAIHASPPCQGYTELNSGRHDEHPKLISDVRRKLQQANLPFIIENVDGARSAIPDALRLCGSMFGLGVQRHRLFESNILLMASPRRCDHTLCTIGVYGAHVWDYSRTRPNGRKDAKRPRPAYGTVAQARLAMGIDWMTQKELTQAIPPAFTEWLGRQLMVVVEREQALAIAG